MTTKISITYRATIDRYVPVAIRSRFGKTTAARSKFFIIRERIRITA
jgi:hypothetical protein